MTTAQSNSRGEMVLQRRTAMYTTVSLAGVLFLLWLVTAWTQMEPSVLPDEVQLYAKLNTASADLKEFLPHVQWELVVTVDSTSGKPLRLEGRYHNMVYPFSTSTPLDGPDFMLGWARGRTVVPEGFGNVGAEGATITTAVRRLKAEGYLPETYDERSAYAPGFSHLFTQVPSRVRYHLERPPEQIAVVYVHEETRFGRDLTWSKVLYVDP